MNLFTAQQQIFARLPFCLLGLIGLVLNASPVDAQVNGPGPSDPALFDTVINVPPDPNIGDNQSIGGVAGQTTQFNLSDGGTVGRSFDVNSGSEVNISGGITLIFSARDSEVNISGGSVARAFATDTVMNITGGSHGYGFGSRSGSEVNISGGSVGSISAGGNSVINLSGGSVGDRSEANPSSVMNISGGVVGENFSAESGSDVNISGGNMGTGFEALPGSDVELLGGEFNLNGAPFTGSTITLSGEDVFTGTLTDGSVFSFSPRSFDELNGVTLTPTALPLLDLTPIVVNTPFPARPSGLRAGQTLTLQDGGQLRNFEAVGATLNIEGGSLHRESSVIRTEVNISGGIVGLNFDGLNVFDESVVNITDGTVARVDAYDSVVNLSGGNVDRFNANSGSLVNISGGNVNRDFLANSGSQVNITGGSLGIQFIASSGSQVDISGGSLGFTFETVSGSDVELFGGEFSLNGAPFTDATISLGAGDVFSGTLSDGSAFIFSSEVNEFGEPNDELSGVRLTNTGLPLLDTTPIVVNTAFPDRPSGLRAGQTLTLQDGGQLSDHFETVGATLNIDGGNLGSGAGFLQSEVNITGGNVDNFAAHTGSVVNISGGNVGSFSIANSGSVVNISGGSVGSLFHANTGSAVNISGGTLPFNFRVLAGSEFNLFGSDFTIDGAPIDGLADGDSLTIVDRGVFLSGLLADGSEFGFRLGVFGFFEDGFFDPEATVTVTLGSPVPEIILGDVNRDGVVNFFDITPFILSIGTGVPFVAEADCNQDGVVDFGDISSLIEILSGG